MKLHRTLHLLVLPCWAGLLPLLGCAADTADARRPGGSTPPAASGASAAPPGVAMPGSAAPAPAAPASAAPVAGSGPTTGPGTSGSACPMGRAHAKPIIPTVWLLIDGSNSMNDLLTPEITRWKALRGAVVDPGGIIPELQVSVRFGLILFSGQLRPLCNPMAHINRACGCNLGYEDACCSPACGAEDTSGIDYCKPELHIVDPAPANGAAVTAAYFPNPIGGWTPTDRALEHVVQQLPAHMASDPTSPVYAVLATDGAPNDICEIDDREGEARVENRVLSAVRAGVDQGMRLFVISLAGQDQKLQAHVEKVAALAKPPTKPLVPASKQQLIDALRSIVTDATCQVSLDGEVVMGEECSGQVLLNGMPLPCNGEHGWKLTDPSTIRLTGDACAAFGRTESTVTAEFPCNAFVPQ